MSSISNTMRSVATSYVILVIILTSSKFLSGEEEYEPNHHIKGNANIGGPLKIISSPGNFELTSKNFNISQKKQDWQNEPSAGFINAMPRKLYTLMMLDASIYPFYKHYHLHWLVTNIPGRDLKRCNVKNGDVLSPYLAPNPENGTGFHVYEFLLYIHVKFPKRQKIKGIPIPESGRKHFDMQAWQDQYYKTTVFIGPLSGTQFIAEYGE